MPISEEHFDDDQWYAAEVPSPTELWDTPTKTLYRSAGGGGALPSRDMSPLEQEGEQELHWEAQVKKRCIAYMDPCGCVRCGLRK